MWLIKAASRASPSCSFVPETGGYYLQMRQNAGYERQITFSKLVNEEKCFWGRIFKHSRDCQAVNQK
tara:strand:+ start:1455 stop:1655 length:201 start_codon:yes stop_codon:yes gene_type:complete